MKDLNDLETKAKYMIERGGPSLNEKFSFIPESGEAAALAAAIYGRNEQEFHEALEAEGKARAIAEQKANPHIYIIKKGKLYEHDRQQYERLINDVSGKYREQIKSRHLSRQEFIDLYNFISDANQEGYILNASLTINWHMLGIDDHKTAAGLLYKGFLHHLKSWHTYHVARRSSRIEPLLWCYVHENSAWTGFHTHLMLRVPDDFISAFKKWLGLRIRKLSKVESVPKRAVKFSAPPSQPLKRQWIRFQYLCKGADPNEGFMDTKLMEPICLFDLIQFRYRDPEALMCKQKMGYSQQFEFLAAYQKECRDAYDCSINPPHLEEFRTVYRSKQHYRSALDREEYDIRKLYPSDLEEMIKIRKEEQGNVLHFHIPEETGKLFR